MFKLKIIFHWLKIKLRGNFSDRNALEKFQQKKLKRFQKNILIKSSYYKKLIVDYDRFNTEVFPVMNKETFMKHMDEINTVGIKSEEALKLAIKSETERDFSPELNGVSVGLSTGTSGKRGLFLVSENERAEWVGMVLNRVIKPAFFKRSKVAFFLRANNNLYSSVNSSLFEFRYFDIFLPLEKLAEDLKIFMPDVIAGQPSVLLGLSEIIDEKKYSVIYEKCRQLISFAEVLEDSVKIKLKKKFVCPLTEVYQCTEGFLGVSCSQGTMHLNEDVVFVEKEFIDETHFVPIITDFTRSSQPVVRYRLDDVLELKKEKCSCGSSMLAIEHISGRAGDVLVFKSSDGEEKLFSDLICRRIALETDDFNDYQILQTGAKEITVSLISENLETEKKISAVLQTLLTERQISGVQINFTKNFQTERGNKFRRVIKLDF